MDEFQQSRGAASVSFLARVIPLLRFRACTDSMACAAVIRQSSTTQCDAAFSPDALMWLLADEAVVLQSGPEKS